MCGICGFLSLKPVADGERVLKRMVIALQHRGPDGRGAVCVAPNAYLGHTRLAIIDLSETGRQPMPNEDGTVWVIYNGEIYNFLELRVLLEQKGHRFRSRTDTEVLVHAYEEWGEEFVTKLRGMFAFGIWNGRKLGNWGVGKLGNWGVGKLGNWEIGELGNLGNWGIGELGNWGNGKLVLARDRLGVKPLYYAYLSDGTLVFASEIKAILEHPGVTEEIDPLAVDAYFAYGYIPAPLTIYKAVRKLPPAHCLVWENGEIRLHRYWQLDFTHKRNESADELAEELRERLKETVKLHLISDVPLGAFLSGGMDSSSIVALMAQVSGRPIKTFSIGFDDDRYNELPYARLIAQRYGTEHHEFIVTAPTAELLPELLGYFDEPFADSSALPTYVVSKLAREHVTVALSGDGGDELFAGYEWTRRALMMGKLGNWAIGKLGNSEAGKTGHQIAEFPNFLSDGWAEAMIRHGKGWRQQALKLWRDFRSGPIATFQRRTRTPFAIRQLLYGADLLAALNGLCADDIQNEFLAQAPVRDWREGLLYCDAMLYLPDDCLCKVDRMSMAVALEVRPPLLDHTVVEFAASLPFGMKLRGRTTKYLLKRAMAKDLPPETMRQRKQGFSVPVAKWMRGQLADELLSFLGKNDPFVNAETVRQMVELHRSGKANFGHLIWRLYVWGLWREKVLP